MSTMFRRKIFTKRKTIDETLLPYAGGVFLAWCIVWLLILSVNPK